jgi:hypothetical protein
LDETKKKTRKLLTVDSILTQDNVKNLLQRLVKDQKNITVMLCIYRDREECLSWKTTEGATIDQIIAMLEQTKLCILTQTEEE